MRSKVLRSDLYPDVEACLAELRDPGYRVGIAGNHSLEADADVISLGLPVDVVGSSARWRAEKPSPAFFRRIVHERGYAPAETAYVGDRVDNDIDPAAAAGLVTVFVRRGPWAHLQAGGSVPERASLVVDSLVELPRGLRALA